MAIKRICVIVLDGAGVGSMPDAADFGDLGANTLGNIHKKRGLSVPHLYSLGLGNIEQAGLPAMPTPIGAYGRMAGATRAKDTTSGHWELAGLIMDEPFRTFCDGFPEEMLQAWLERCGYPIEWLGNAAASGTEIIERLGPAHMETRRPIVYTSADSVFQVAAHEDIIPLDEQYRLCGCAREVLTGEWSVGRVIARPFLGSPGNFVRTKNRRDFSVPPVGDTILDGLARQGIGVFGIGKIEDIFHRRGISRVDHTTGNRDGIEATIKALRQEDGERFIFTNLVDFDMLYGHRNDADGFALAMESFDAQLPRLMEAMRPGDVLMVTADHGCDPTYPTTDHTREYVPVLAWGPGVAPVNLGTRKTFADLGATAYKALTGEFWGVGESFLGALITE